MEFDLISLGETIVASPLNGVTRFAALAGHAEACGGKVPRCGLRGARVRGWGEKCEVRGAKCEVRGADAVFTSVE